MNEDLLALYDILEKEGVFSSQEEMQSVIDAEGVGVLYDAVPSGIFGSKQEFLSVFQPQEELTPEMMETGQRDAAPAYAMTEEKYAAEKKSPTESPLQDGVSADAVEEPVVEEGPVGIFPVEEETVEEVSEEPVGIFPTEEKYKAKVPDFEDYGKKILSGEMTMKDIKTPDQIFEDKMLKKSASEANRIVTNATIDLQKAIDQSPEIQGVVSKVQAKYQSQYQDKVDELTSLVNSGEMTEADANIELQKFSSVMNKRISDESSKDPEFVKEVGRLKSIADEEINKQIADLQEEISIESEIRAQDKIQELGFWEGIGNAIQNEWTKTKMLPAQSALYAGQISEDIESDDPSWTLAIDGDGVSFKKMTNKERQIENYKEIKRYEEQMKDVLPIIESYERGNYTKAASGAVSNAIQFMGSIARAIPTLGSSAVYEMGTPMYIDAVEAEAKRSGLTPEEVIANDTEDEITAMALGTMAGALETFGLGKSVGFIKNKILKDAVEETVKKNKKRIGKELWDITTRAAIETETEVTQGALEEANKELQERGIKIGAKGSGKTIWENVRDAVTLSTDESRETAVATFLGSVLMFGGGRAGRIAIRKGESVKVDGKQISQEDFQSFLDNATDEQIAAAEIDIKGNDALKKAAEQKKKDIREDAIIKRDLAEAGITDAGRVSELVPLEKEKKKLQGNTTEAGKKKLQEINAQIEEVMAKEPTEEVVAEQKLKTEQDAIQKQSPEGVDVQEPAADSQAVGEGDVRETTTEGKPKITVTEETQEVTDETLKDLENVPEPVIRGLAVKNLNGETLTEQEQQVFDANQEAVEQMASDIEQVSQAEVAETERKLRGETSAEDRTIIARQVNRAKRAISKILPDVEIVMHDTEDSYNGVITDPDGEGSAGTYDPNTNKIHINMSKANPRTVSHEVFHAVVRRAFGGGKLSDPALSAATVKMLDAVKRGASKRMLSAKSSITGETVENYIKRFSEGYEKGQQSEEQLSELAGILAENFMELDVNAKTTIKAWIGRMAEKLGINKALGTKIYSREMTDKDAIDLLNTIAGKTAKGEIIKEAKTLDNLFKSEDSILEEESGTSSRFQRNEDITRIAEEYISKNNLERLDKLEVKKLDPEYSKAIADIYESAKDDSNNPEVKEAYKAMADEVMSQFDALMENGYKVKIFEAGVEPYESSKEMLADLKENKRLVVFSTEEGFGEQGITQKMREENPMLADSGRKDVDGKPMLVNDVFRFVHDAFGHGELGNGFGPIGEENAWYVHSQMFSPKARAVMTTETRGQNSWVNFGKHLRRKDGSIPKRGDSDYVPLQDRPFAPQKNFLFPEEYVLDTPNTSGRFQGQSPVSSRFQKAKDEFARITSVDIPTDIRFPSSERDFYTKSVNEAVSKGLSGIVVPKSVFNEIAVDENRFDVKKRGDEFVITPKKDNVLTARFQADYTNPVTNMTYVYDKNIDAWKRLEEIGKITKDKTIKYLQDKMVMIHAPDAAFSGEMQRNGETLVEGKGGLYFPIKFRDQNLVWASTRRAAEKMVEQFNEMARENGGKAYMVLTSAPYDKVLSSTIAANAVMDIFISKAVDRKINIKKGDVLSAIITAANTREEVKTEDEKGNVSLKMVGLGMGLNKTSKFEDAIASIREKLGPDNSSFSDRKMFSETLAGEMAKLINSSDTKTANFFFELFNNPQFKGKIPKTTGKYSASKANVIQGLSYMFAEPCLRPLLDTNIGGKRGLTGMAYAILEAEGPFEAVEIKGHESYPVAIKGLGAINIHLLENPVKWTDFIVDPETGETISSKKRANSIMPPSAGISMNPLRVDASKVDVADSKISLSFQAPTATAFTIYDAINELRGKGYTDSAIELFISRQINPDTQKKFTKTEIAKAMAVPIDIENTLPSAFGDVEGGISQGQKMFAEVMERVKRSAARMRPANPAKIRAKAHQILMAHPDFDKQSATMKNRLILGLDSALGTTANKAIQAEISSIKKMIKGGKMSLRELKAAQVRLRAMIRKELPNDKQYSKTVVNNLIKMVTDATPETMDQVVNDVTSAINEQRSERFISDIENIINQSFTTTQAGRKKGAKVTATFADAIAFAKERLAEMRKVADNEEDFQDLMEKTRKERESLFSQIDTMTEEDISKILAYDLILEYGKTFVEENTEQSTVEALELSLDMAKDLVNTGRAFMKEQLRLAHEAYKEQFNTAFEDITGIDVRGMDEAQREDVSGSLRIGAEQRNKNLSRVAKVMAKVFDRANTYFARNEDLSGFMDILSKGAGEMFGGKLQEIVKQRVDDSSNVYKKGMMDIREMTESKAREIFGKRWKKVISVGNRIPIETGLKAFGKDLIYSQNEMYYLYNMAKDPANHPSFEKKFGKDWRDIMDGIEKLMTPEVKEWADWQVNEFYPMMYERYNPVYRRIYRTNLGWNKFYAGKIYRQSVDGNEDINLLEQKMGPAMTVAGGSTKHRVKNNVPIAAVDGNLAMGRYIEEMEKFRAYQETVRDVSKIFNNKDIKNAIKEQYGESFHNLFSKMLERYLTGNTEKGDLGSIVGTGNRIFLFSKLGYNLSLVWKQLTSIPTYANDIGYANWALYSAKIWASPISTAKEIYENSTYIKDRYAGDFLAVVDVFSKNKENTISMGEGTDFYINKTIDAITRYGMAYTKGGDAMAIFLGGAPNYLYYKNEFKKKNPSATEQQTIDYAIKKFEKDTRGTQQSNDIQDRDFYQTGNQFMRSMMLFTTSPRQYWRKSMSGYRQLYRKMKGVPSKGTVLENLRTILTYRIMMPMLYTWATMGFPPPWDLDDDEENELMWSALLGNISALFMIGHIGIAVKDFMTGAPWAGRMPLPPIMQIAADMIEDMTSLSKTKDPIKREQKKEEVYMKMINNVLPQKNLDKSFGNWYRTSTGDQEFNLRKMAGYSDYVADKDARKMEEELEQLRKMAE